VSWSHSGAYSMLWSTLSIVLVRGMGIVGGMLSVGLEATGQRSSVTTAGASCLGAEKAGSIPNG